MAKSSGINRTVNIPQPNLFGRIGTGFGQGLAEQLPKEIERNRLSAGLQNLSQQEGLTPFQQFAGLASLPGTTPQIIQSGADILRQQGISQGFQNIANQTPEQKKNQALQDIAQNAQSGNISASPNNAPGYGGFKDVATTEGTQATLKPFIPPTLQEIQARAGQLQKAQPQLYPRAEDALAAAQTEANQLAAQNQALINQRLLQQGVQKELNSQLDAARGGANAIIPDNVYQPIKNKAFDDVREGRMTEAEAADKAVKEMDKISREYQNIAGLGNWTFDMAPPKSIHRAIENTRQDFKKRNDLENFADTLVAKNGLSYQTAYSTAYPLTDYPQIKNIIDKNGKPSRASNRASDTLKIAPELAKLMKDQDASPIAIGEYLHQHGFDRKTWDNYVDTNRRSLNLGERQGRELSKPKNIVPNLNDIWFQLGQGNDKFIGE